MDDISIKIGRLISQARTHIGLSAEDVAVELGISTQELMKMELGEQRPTPAQLVDLSDLFRVMPSWFFPMAEDMKMPPTRQQAEAKLEVVVEQVRVYLGRNFDEVTLRRLLGVLKQR